MRNFPNWIDAYLSFSKDDYCPPQFHLWTGLSVLAGALERKVWVSQGMVVHYPNIYVLCVSHPGVGKSTAIERGVELLEEIKEHHNPEFKVIPNQITEPALLEMMKTRQEMIFGTKVVFHSSGYFYASEASASALQNLFGDFNATITAMYDCPKMFRKKIKSEPTPTEIPNACFNLLAGATPEYLKNLVNEQSVMGGFASRLIYVICKDRIVREAHWDGMFETDGKKRDALLADLLQIHKLQGRFTPTRGFIERWEKFQPEFDRFLIDLNSPRMESLYARKGTNLMKVCMLLSVAESDRLDLTEDHWERAHALVEEVSKDNAYIISQAAIADKTSQNSATQVIYQTLKRHNGEMSMKTLKALALMNGNNVDTLTKTIEFLLSTGTIEQDLSTGKVKLLVDPDRYL